MELIWGSLTLCLAASDSFSTLCAIRFFIGLAESTFFPAIQVRLWSHVLLQLMTIVVRDR
jgi:predicted MFS family arabinose efflux permease